MTKILLIEDNEMNRDMLSRRLQKLGHERKRQSGRRSSAMYSVLGDSVR